MVLSNEDLNEVVGGGIKIGVSIVVAAVVTFVIGVIDGYFRPLKCNK
ncbi:MAG: hypothetical protein K2G03_01890 [Bacilli bacterium]|nr:hypothetical protein [Bacilli bacterium]